MKLHPLLGSVKGNTITGLVGGGDEPDNTLTPQKMKEWNQFLDFIKTKGYEGSEKLDHDKALGQSLFNEFKKNNPNVSISYDIVTPVQTEMQKLKESAQSFAERRKDPNAKQIMANVSKVDGFLGSKTSQFRFPDMTLNQVRNNNLVGSTNLGLVKSGLQPTGAAATVVKPIPKGVELEDLYDAQGNKTGKGYTDPSSGDVIRVNQ